MSRARLFPVLLGIGWVMYAASLVCPAVAVVSPPPGSSSFDVGTIGFLCLVMSLGSALESPYHFALALANLLMLASLASYAWIRHTRPSQTATAGLLKRASLASYAWAERVPRRASILFFAASCIAGLIGLFAVVFFELSVGYWLWLGSFIVVGVAFLVRPAQTEPRHEPLPPVTESSATAIEYGDSNFRENN